MRPPRVIAGWGVLMAAIGAVAVLFYDIPDPETPALFGGAAAVMIVLGLGLRLLRLGSAAAPAPRTSPDLSPATVWLGVSIVVTAVGAELGLWLVLIGAGMLTAGIGGLVRELRAEGEAGRAADASALTAERD